MKNRIKKKKKHFFNTLNILTELTFTFKINIILLLMHVHCKKWQILPNLGIYNITMNRNIQELLPRYEYSEKHYLYFERTKTSIFSIIKEVLFLKVNSLSLPHFVDFRKPL